MKEEELWSVEGADGRNDGKITKISNVQQFGDICTFNIANLLAAHI